MYMYVYMYYYEHAKAMPNLEYTWSKRSLSTCSVFTINNHYLGGVPTHVAQMQV